MAEDAFGGWVTEENSVTLGKASWIGLGAGIVVGTAVGLLLYSKLLAIDLFPISMDSRWPLLTILWAVTLGASGWIIGMAVHLFSPSGTGYYELHITVPAERLPEINELLNAEGATVIKIREHFPTASAFQRSGYSRVGVPLHAYGS